MNEGALVVQVITFFSMPHLKISGMSNWLWLMIHAKWTKIWYADLQQTEKKFAYFRPALIEKCQYPFMLMMNGTWLTYLNVFFSISQVAMKPFLETFQLADSLPR